MAAQDELIGTREVSYRVGWSIIVIAGGPSVHDLPLHLVLGDDETSLMADEIGKRAVTGDLRRRDRGAIEEPLFGRQFAERRGLCRSAKRRAQTRGADTQPDEPAGKNATAGRTRRRPWQHLPHGIPRFCRLRRSLARMRRPRELDHKF